MQYHLVRGEGRVWQSDKSVPGPRIEPRTPSTLPLDRQLANALVVLSSTAEDGEIEMDEVSDYMKVVEKSANKSLTSLHQLNTVLRQQPRQRNGAR
uniref:Uncharacterized protein n=1 Tax=Timema monikensis TaxID=170555 RepID=A0A7R9EG90_9NEOP|nr:unnamed protein product [Timema monikensis]